MEGYSAAYESALTLAARAHRQQLRKGSDIPYLVHPVHVSSILLRYGFCEELVIAALLHDVVEDQEVPIAEIQARFGPVVARIVADVTERKREGGVERPWEVRKEEALAHLREAGDDSVTVKAADLLHNAHTLAGQLRQDGPAVWRCYARGADSTLWYYRSLATIARRRLGDHPLVGELDLAIQDLEQAISESDRP